MARELKVQGGKLLLWRLGSLEYGEQSRWGERTPRGETSGMWAFPWPYFDMFFAYHKYTDLLPKRFHTTERNFPLYNISEWYEAYDDESGTWRSITASEEKELREWTQATKDESMDDDEYMDFPDKFTISQRFYDAQDEWIQKVGKKILPLRKFYYEGDLYSRLGNLSHDGAWTRMGSAQFAREVKRGRGIATVGREKVWNGKDGDALEFVKANRYFSQDYLEVFLPRGGGRILGKM